MEQKSYKQDYKLEIVADIANEENHIRGIAKKLFTNPMTIMRKVKELEKENVIDYKIKGKNKVYSLKKTAEARSYIIKSENYKLVKLLSRYPSLRIIVDKIQEDSRIKLAVLFGSYAKGLAGKDSDIDIYIETQNRDLRDNIRLLDSKLSVKIGKYDKSSLLIKEIEKNHIIIKGAEIYYEKNKFFG